MNSSSSNHIFCLFTEASYAGTPSIMERLENLVGNSNISHDAQKDLLTWTLKTIREVRVMRDNTVSMDSSVHEREAELSSKAEQERKRKVSVVSLIHNMASQCHRPPC